MGERQQGPTSETLDVRAVMAVVLLVGFYLGAMIVAVLMIRLPWSAEESSSLITVLRIVSPVAAILLLWSVMPLPEPWIEPGLPFDETTQPNLTKLIDDLARELEVVPPRSLYLADEANVYLTQRGGFLGFGGSRVLVVGVPLMAMLDKDELRSAIAHEFGHFDNSDLMLGPIVYRTRNAIGRALDAMDSAVLHKPFAAFARFYVDHTTQVAQAQEDTADRIAGKATSAHVAATALAKAEVGRAAFEVYEQANFQRLLNSGCRAPYVEGFRRLLQREGIAQQVMSDGVGAFGESAGTSFESHPATGDRIRGILTLGGNIEPELPPIIASVTLLRDVTRVEDAFVYSRTKKSLQQFEALTWDDIELQVPPRGALARTAVGPDDRARVETPVEHVPATVGAGSASVLDLDLPALDLPALDVPDLDLPARSGGSGGSGTSGSDNGSGPLLAPSASDVPSSRPASDDSWPLGFGPNDGRGERFEATPPGQRGIGRKKTLRIDGPTISWGSDTIKASAVTKVSYQVDGDTHEFLAQGDGKQHVHFKVDGSGGDAKEVQACWTALVDWSDRRVEGRLVDELIGELDRAGQLTIGHVGITRGGVKVKGRSVPWLGLAGAGLNGNTVEIHELADTPEGGRKWATLDAMVPGAVLVPGLLQILARQ